jgi:hypothetical protein
MFIHDAARASVDTIFAMRRKGRRWRDRSRESGGLELG